jgi:hypothetical protein
MRVRNWDVKLLAWARQRNGDEFRWGRTDCGTLVVRAHRIMFGRRVLGILPVYSSLRAARDAFAATGGVEAVLRSAGAVEVAVPFAQQGDVLIERDLDERGFPSAAVVVAGHVLYSNVDAGVRLIPLRDVIPDVVLRLPHG